MDLHIIEGLFPLTLHSYVHIHIQTFILFVIDILLMSPISKKQV